MTSVLLAVMATGVMTAGSATAEPKPKIRKIVHHSQIIPNPPNGVGTAACANAVYNLPSTEYTIADPSEGLESYYVNADLLTWLDEDDVLYDIQRAFSTWSEESNDCTPNRADSSSFSFSRTGTTTRERGSLTLPGDCSEKMDGYQDVTFVDPPLYSNTATTVVCIEDVPGDTWKVLEWDMEIDAGLDIGLGTAADPGTIDIWNLVAHEVGHVIGMGHAAANQCGVGTYPHAYLTMYPCVWSGDTGKRTLGLGDMLGLEYLNARRP